MNQPFPLWENEETNGRTDGAGGADFKRIF